MLKEFFIENEIQFNENELMRNHTTFKVGGYADFVIYPKDKEQAKKAIKFFNKHKVNYYYLGKGSNVIFKDEGYKGVIIKSNLLNKVSIKDDIAEVESGYVLTSFCKLLQENSLSGLEFCYGIPGNIGGSIYMNAGAYGGEIKDSVYKIDCLDENGDEVTILKNAAKFSYRHSIFQERKLFILKAYFKLNKSDSSKMLDFMKDIMHKRMDKQPLDLPSAGSSFKRPEGYFAAALIDECGLKGMRVGGAMVSDKHAGFIVNVDNASCNDIVSLAEKVEKIVFEKTGVKIDKEMIII